MYICICKQITDGQIRDAVREKGITSLQAICKELGACNQCGKCARAAKQVLGESIARLRPATVDNAISL